MSAATDLQPLYRPADVERMDADLPIVGRIARWCREFLMRPSPDLGRSGSVCPFMPRAMHLNHIAFAVVRTRDRSENDVDRTIAAFRAVFLAMEPVSGPESLEKAILVILPDVGTEDAPAVVDETHRRLKAEFVASGLMIGKFHPTSDQGGLHNPAFRPLRSPIPLLAIRYMVGSDLPFLNRADDPVPERIEFLESYEQRFKGADEARWSERGRAALTEIRGSEEKTR